MTYRTITQSRQALATALGGFVAAQMLFNVAADLGHPELYDAEYGIRLALLRARIAEAPERPLLLLMGSSRTTMAFRPESLEEIRADDGSRVLAFNFSHLAAGPVMHLVEYNRLRRNGIRPRWLVLEVMPPGLCGKQDATLSTIASIDDLPVMHPYVDSLTLYGRYTMLRLAPWHRHRNEIVHALAPMFVSPGMPSEEERIHLGPLGGDEYWQIQRDESPELIKRATDHAEAGYRPRLQNFKILEMNTRVYGQILEQCRKDGVQVVLLMTPEGTNFRAWYTPEALQQVETWCGDMRRRHGATIIDARTWLDDRDMMDGHHVFRRGAEAFTRRLETEVLLPLVRSGTAAGFASEHSSS